MRNCYERSAALSARAEKIIPGGHHLSGRPLVDVETTPMYFESALGAYIKDVDGRTYVDWLMAFGPYLLGYAQPDVEHAAFEQARHGRLLSLNHPLHVAFIEALLPLFPGAQMGCFFRNGSEATTAALRIARRATGRRRVARCGYHGWHDWCLPLESFVPEGLDAQVLEFDGNQPASLKALFARYPNEIAAVILAPEMLLPLTAAKLADIAVLARGNDAVFIMDEVKTGFRSPQRSISAHLGVTPDVITVSKAMGNGWPVAALLGSRQVMEYGNDMHLSGTFHGDVSAMAAALKAIELIDATGAAAHAQTLGRMLIDGLLELGQRHDIALTAFPEPIDAMPFMRFTHPDVGLRKRITDTFYRRMLAQGVLLHPRHLWFPSLAHTAVDVERTLEAANQALFAVAELDFQ
jgi:glutamate-1-semialdehyde 2,1-aminomutase